MTLLPSNNVSPHTARVSGEKLLDLVWEIKLHKLLGLDLLSPDCHLLLSLWNAIQGQKFNDGDHMVAH